MSYVVKEKMKLWLLVFVAWGFIFTAAGMQGCQSTPTPQTPTQVLAVADASLTGLINAAATAKQGGLMSPAQVDLFRDKAKEAENYLNSARVAISLGHTNMTDVSLKNAREILLALNRLLLELERQP